MKIYRREKTVEIYVKTQNVENLSAPENRHSGASPVRETVAIVAVAVTSLIRALWTRQT